MPGFLTFKWSGKFRQWDISRSLQGKKVLLDSLVKIAMSSSSHLLCFFELYSLVLSHKEVEQSYTNRLFSLLKYLGIYINCRIREMYLSLVVTCVSKSFSENWSGGPIKKKCSDIKSLKKKHKTPRLGFWRRWFSF